MAIEDEGDALTLPALRKLIEMRVAADAAEPRQIETTAEVKDEVPAGEPEQDNGRIDGNAPEFTLKALRAASGDY